MPSLSGGKWGGSALGSSGGVVTWSLIAPGERGVINGFETAGQFRFGEDETSDAQRVTGFNVTAALRGAFQSWADIADIRFIQVADGGERVAKGFSADIRIAFGYVDGVSGSTLGLAYFVARGEREEAGDILFDQDEYVGASDKRIFQAVAAHEIGHSIGLRHVSETTALMAPIVGEFIRPQADDIEGAVQLYGRPDGDVEWLTLTDRTPEIQIVERASDLHIRGTGDDNRIIGAKGGEEMRGLGGDDDLFGGGGPDSLFGGGGADFQNGGGGADRLIGNGGDDTLIGGGRGDILKGGGGADTLRGGGGADDLNGGGRSDIIDGGRGEDTLKGGGGADVFVLTGGRDIVTDFKVGVDRISVSVAAEFDEVSISDGAEGAVVEKGARSLVLHGVAASDLGEDSFIFGPAAATAATVATKRPTLSPAEDVSPVTALDGRIGAGSATFDGLVAPAAGHQSDGHYPAHHDDDDPHGVFRMDPGRETDLIL